jgi:Lysine methyltransferase
MISFLINFAFNILLQCWDAAFILAEHLIAHESEWNKSSTCLVELGSGTGLCGLMLAKATLCHVQITDLPALLPLMARNVRRNMYAQNIVDSVSECRTEKTWNEQGECEQLLFSSENFNNQGARKNAKDARGTVSASVLRWGMAEDYCTEYDVVIGADVVASLYDPIALADTMHALCCDQSVVYVSYKERLTDPHIQFQDRLECLFENVERIRPTSRNRNPQVWILKATGKR